MSIKWPLLVIYSTFIVLSMWPMECLFSNRPNDSGLCTKTN